MTGTFGRIFHGVLLDEKDPSKEKQVFVKSVKGRRSVLAALHGSMRSCQRNLKNNVNLFHLIYYEQTH